jgi:hypothetical protein
LALCKGSQNQRFWRRCRTKFQNNKKREERNKERKEKEGERGRGRNGIGTRITMILGEEAANPMNCWRPVFLSLPF